MFSNVTQFIPANFRENSIDVLLIDEAHRISQSSNNQYTPAEKRTSMPQVETLIRAANVCVFFSLTNEYINFVQSKKRLDRIGQTKKPLFYYLICKDTVEEATWKSLQEGKDFDERMFEKYLEGCDK